MLAIPASPNTDSPLSNFLKPEMSESENQRFRPSCNCLLTESAYLKITYTEKQSKLKKKMFSSKFGSKIKYSSNRIRSLFAKGRVSGFSEC